MSQIRQTASAVLRGTSRVGRSGMVDLSEQAMRVIAQILLVLLGFGLFGLISGAVIGSIVAAILAVAIIPIEATRPERRHFRSLVSFAKYSFVKGFSTKFYDNIDTIVIVLMVGTSATGIYNLGFRFSLVLAVFSGAIATSSLPEISRHAAANETERVKEIIGDGVIFSTMISIPAFFGMLLLARPIIVTFYTPKFAAGATVATIAVALQVPDALRSIFSSAIDGLDRPDITFRAGLILIGTNALLDIILVPTIGIEGAAVASLMGITTATGYQGYKTFQILGLSWRDLPLRSFGAEIIAGGIMAIVVFVIRRAISLPQIPELIVLIVTGVICYFTALLLLSRGVRIRLFGIADDIVSV